MTEEIIDTLKTIQPDVTDREAKLFEFIYRTFSYIPPNLMNLTLGIPVRQEINEWIEKTYKMKLMVR